MIVINTMYGELDIRSHKLRIFGHCLLNETINLRFLSHFQEIFSECLSFCEQVQKSKIQQVNC